MLNTLYNAALQERRDAWRTAGKKLRLYDQQKSLTDIRKDCNEWRDVSVAVSRGVLHRLDRAMQGFFRRVKAEESPGFPRFKPLSRFRCIELSDVAPRMVRLNGSKAAIRIKGLPVIELRLSRPLPPSEQLRSLRLVKQARGWYADLTYEIEKESLSHSDAAVGIDLGVTNRLALSTGEFIEGVKPSDTSTLQRRIARCKRGSRRQRKLYRQLARLRHRRRISHRNEAHRITTGIVRRFGRIAVEDLRIRNMTRSAKGTIEEPGTNVAAKRALNRSILEQRWGILRHQLRYKAAWADREYVEVNPKNTSRMCSECGSITQQTTYRLHICMECGAVFDRDYNAARNILYRAFGHTGAGIPPALLGARTIAVSAGHSGL